MKLKCPNLLKPLDTIIQENYQPFYPSEPFRILRFQMRHPVVSKIRGWFRKILWPSQNIWTFLNLFCHFADNFFLSDRKIPKPTDIIEYLRHAAVKRIGLGYGLSPSGGEADILRPIREDGFRQSPTETMYEVSVQNWRSSNHKGTW